MNGTTKCDRYANGDDSRWLYEEEADGRKGTLREKKLRAPVTTMKYVSPLPQQRLETVSLHVRQQNLPYPFFLILFL